MLPSHSSACTAATTTRTPAWFLLCALACLALAGGAAVAAEESLRVENPAEIAYSIAALTDDAIALGLSSDGLTGILNARLAQAGLTAQPAAPARNDGVLFLDIIVEDETYYASLGFWRTATVPLPDGDPVSDTVIVWQDFSVGTHDDDAALVNKTVRQIVDRFVARYSAANGLATPLRVAASP